MNTPTLPRLPTHRARTFWLACIGFVFLLLCGPAHAARDRAYIDRGTVLSDQGTLLRGPFIKLWNRTIYPVNSSAPALYQPAYWQPYKDAGFNNVRIVVAWGSQYPSFNATTTLQALDELVAVFAGLDMYVTICGSANDYNWFHKTDLQDQWAQLAPRYKDHTHVMYEVQNEPMGDPNGFFSNVSPPKGDAFDLVDIYHSIRAAAPDTIIAMWGFSALGNNFNDALWAIQAHDPQKNISYDKTAVAFHYYPPTLPAYVASLQNKYPAWMTEGSDEAPGGTTDCDFEWYLDCERKGISWNSMDFQDTLQKCLRIKAYLVAQGHGWTNDLPSPKHRWKLDESSGTTATDSAGGKHGAVQSGAWQPAGGVHGGGFSATSPWNRITTPSIALGDRYTFAAWINIGASTSANQVVFSNRDNGLPDRSGVSLMVGASDRKLKFYTANGAANRTVSSFLALEPGAWEHVAVTVDNSTGACRLYLNGMDVTGTGSILADAKTNGGIALANYWDGGWGLLSGSIDDARIYDTVLGPDLIGALDPLWAATLQSTVILDNSDAARVVRTGAWTSSTSTSGFHGSDYLHDGNTGATGGKRVAYSPALPSPGRYRVYLRWTAGTNRASNAPVDIAHDGGTTTVSVNQRQNHATWVSLGDYDFAQVAPGITLRNDGADGYVIADAVRLVRTEVVVDNNDPARVVLTGTWTASGFTPGYLGGDYLHDGNTGSTGGKRVAYSPSLPIPGRYRVYLRWTAETNRASNAPVDIAHDGGTTTISVNQRQNHATWVSLGDYDFTQVPPVVTLRNDGANGHVIADAVRLVLQ